MGPASERKLSCPSVGGWESGQLERIRTLLPHLRQYVPMRAALEDAGVLGATLESLLDGGHLAVIQLDHRKRIVETNDRARQMLLEQDGIADRAASLQAAAPGDNARLQALLAEALPTASGQGQSGSMTLRRLAGPLEPAVATPLVLSVAHFALPSCNCMTPHRPKAYSLPEGITSSVSLKGESMSQLPS